MLADSSLKQWDSTRSMCSFLEACGKYCFYPAGGVQVVGDAVNASGRLYDFGVD